ncbi:hypothetical protein AVEN_108368-1 [Araneus ventricosus]|uniref:Uncharacterized protein n=1 Tax=Araneus ventricosus TaxID=182803 RepID=A0A4Y2CXC3_ARAVE|nr:hypothetical protein AVEN_108368-1 [Araneus ventricosus]
MNLRALKATSSSLLSNINSYRNHPNLAPSRQVHLNNSRCNSSSAKAEILVVITSYGPALPAGYHRQWESPSHCCTNQGSETSLTYPAASHPRTLGVPPVGLDEHKIFCCK